MPAMPTYHVTKGSQFGFLDQQFGGANFMNEYASALGRLQGPGSVGLDAAAAAHAPNQLSQSDVTHFTNHWLGNWWQALAVPDTLRAGFTQAITHAQNVQKPIEVLWICAQDRAFHVYYCEGPRQVTVLVFTPPPDTGPAADPLGSPEQIWVVKLRDNFDNQYPNKGPNIPAPVQVAAVTSGPMQGQPIIKQQLFHA
jgi:hypothetical protein